MNINELLESTRKIRSVSADEGLPNFGTVYALNKKVKVKPKYSVVEISMMISGLTDKIYAGNGSYRAVAAHLVKIAIGGVKQEVCTGNKLVKMIRALPEYQEKYADKKAYPKEDILKWAVENKIKYFKDKSVFKGSNPDEYVLIEDKISDDSKVRVWCSCSDYYWTFLYYNIQAGVSVQKRPPSKYTHKTKKGAEDFAKNKPVRNPDRRPSACKHIMLLLSMLMEDGVIEPKGDAPNSLLREYNKNVKKTLKTEELSESGYDTLVKNYKRDHKMLVDRRSIFGSGYENKKKKSKTWKGWNKKKHSFGK